MNIGIQEAEHFEGVYPIIRLFDNGKNRLFLFVTRNTYVQLLQLLKEDVNRFTWIIQELEESSFQYSNRMKQTIKNQQISLLYLNTISKHHLIYAWLVRQFPQLYTILTVHDVNDLFKPVFSLNPRLLAQYFGKMWLRNQVSAYNTISNTVIPYLKSNAGVNKPVFAIPGGISEQVPNSNPIHKTLHIVIPGTIDKQRRIYEHVIELAKAIADLPVHFTLLGGGKDEYANQIRKTCQLVPHQFTCYDTELVESSEFDVRMHQAHFVWIPSAIYYNGNRSGMETYGITKSSGNIFDIIKYSKPFFYPAPLHIPEELKSSGVEYNSLKELMGGIEKILADPDYYSRLENAAWENAQKFTIDKIRETNPILFSGSF